MAKYHLPPNHALFTSQTAAELRLEMYEDLLERQESLKDDLAAFDASGAQGRDAHRARGRMLDALNAINVALGDAIEEYDPIVARWERELAAGQMPNLRER